VDPKAAALRFNEPTTLGKSRELVSISVKFKPLAIGLDGSEQVAHPRLLSLQVNPLDRRANYSRLWGNDPIHVENLPSVFLSDCSSFLRLNFARLFLRPLGSRGIEIGLHDYVRVGTEIPR